MANKVKTSDLKSRFLHLAQTSVYQVKLQPPAPVVSYLNANGFNYNSDGEDVELRCKSVAFPSSSLDTHDQDNDYTGVTELMAYRRTYTDIAFEFYVDNRYDVIEMFDGWMEYISGQDNSSAAENPYQGYRMRFPNNYKTNVFVSKFEKGFEQDEKSHQMDYTFVSAFPISTSGSGMSYDESQILTYTVNMSYLRYTRKRSTAS